MSSDESTSTQFSTFSDREVKHRKPEPWEINFIGTFLLDLYHRSLIGYNNDWSINKSVLREEYSKIINKELSKKLKDLNGTDDIGTMLRHCGFLLKSPMESLFKIKYFALFEYRNILLEDNNEIDEDIEKIPLEYQRTATLKRNKNFIPTKMSCYICQENFTTIESYEDHIKKHGEGSDFEFLNTMDKLTTSLFNINYIACKNPKYFCFEIKTDANNLIIKQIIIVQSRSFYYVHNMRVQLMCLANGKNRFFVHSHLFTTYVEQPIILIFHRKGENNIRIIEQHHFMRSDILQNNQISINPYRLPNTSIFEQRFHVGDYLPTTEIRDALNNDLYCERLMRVSNGFRDYIRSGKKLLPYNIAESINILLQMEDMDTILQYVNLTQKGINLRSYGDVYSFRFKTKQHIFIDNILTIYDEVILTSNTDISTKSEDILKLMMQNESDIENMRNTFIGKIYTINMGRISFKCNRNIKLQSQYTVIFRPSRLNVRYQYRCLESLPLTMDYLKKFLFPAVSIPRPISNTSLPHYNWYLNDEQLQAVRNIYEGPRNDATYIIFGPPGTGKTATLVEGILHLLRKDDTKILVTSSTDSACDAIAKQLCKYLKHININPAMARIYPCSSEIRTESIDEELLEYSNMYNGHFYPDIDILHRYRIVVCTLSVVAKLATGKFGRSNNGKTLYTHLIIDDVAASTEAEALVGITTVLTPNSCLIISGDNKQLRPILKSKRAEELGLGISLLDRLLERDCYRIDVNTGLYDRTIQTRLTRNYRSHPAIVNLYSGLYYNHSLESCANKDDVSLCELLNKSRNKQYPIMFHAIYEPSKTDTPSHSLYNLSELNVVMDYVKDLMNFGINGKPVKESDIGIISPYKKQFKNIQEELNLRKWFGIETGSVETFQGKEKHIIIVSFVLSGTNKLDLLDNPRHLNVTISRPKSFLILIGNPKTLSLNRDFEYIIKECQRNNTFVESNSPKSGELKKQVNENLSKSKEQLSHLNKKLSTLNIKSIPLKKDVKISNDSKDQKQLKAAINKVDQGQLKTAINKKATQIHRGNDNPLTSSNIKNEKKSDNNIKKVENNDDTDNHDESDSDSDDNSDNDNDKPSTSASAKNKTKSKNNSRKGKNRQEIKNKSATAKVGKITKQYGKGKHQNVGDNKIKNLNKNINDSLLDDLPRVPTTTSQNTSVHFSNPNFLQMQQQDETFNNSQQQQQMQQQHQHISNIVQQQPQQQPFNAYNPYLTHAAVNLPFMQPVPTQYHPTPTVVYPPQMIHHQPSPPYPYATPSYNINGLMHTAPNMPALPATTSNYVMTTDPNTNSKSIPNHSKNKEVRNKGNAKTEQKNNKNISNKNDDSKAKQNKATKKSSKVGANIN